MSTGTTAFNGDAWGRSLSRLRPLLRLLAGRLLNPRHWRKVDPSDMVQKTLIEALEKRDQVRGKSEKEVLAWLKTVLGHRIIDEVRRLLCDRNNADLEVELERANDGIRKMTSPLSKLVRHEDALRVAEALEKLPDDERRAIEFIHFHRLTLAETAQLMELNRYKVARLLKEAQARLRDLLNDSR